MNLPGVAYLIVFKLFFVKSISESMPLSLLVQSDSLISAKIFLNSSIIIGSIGLETILFCFLKVLLVVLNPLGPLIDTLAVLLLKSEADENLPKPSLPAAYYEPLYYPALLVSKELFRMLVPYLVLPLLLSES